jgi:protein O-mannosyl-transferase
MKNLIPFLRSRWPLALPGLAVLLLYLPAVRYGFVWDDGIFPAGYAPLYRDPALWWEALTRPFILSPNYFRPLPLLTFMVELRLGGLNPALFHLTNLLLHAANATLVALLAAILLGGRREASGDGGQDGILPYGTAVLYSTAVVAGLLYGLHPALIEGVAFISSRFDLLLTFFLLLALLAEVKAVGWRRPLLVGAAFLLAALSKEMAVAFVLVLPLWRLARGQAVAAKESLTVYAAVFVAGLVYLGLRFAALGYLLTAAPERSLEAGTPLQHFLLVGRSLGEYLLLIFWPFTSLTPIHYGRLPLPPGSLAAWLSVAAVIGALVILYKQIGQRPKAVWLALAALIALLPVSNILPLELGGGAFVAERFLLWPLVLVVLAAVQALTLTNDERQMTNGVGRWSAVVGRSSVALWLLASAATIQLVAPNWQDDYALWRWGAARAPQSVTPFTNLSLEYSNRGDYQTGLALAEEALARNPDHGDGWNNAGLALFGLNRFEEAAHAFAQAIERQPGNALYWNNLAGALRDQGELGEAERILLDEVLPRDPALAAAYLNLGVLYLRADRPDLAALALQDAMRLAPPNQAMQAEALLRQSAEPERWLRLGDLLLANEAWEESAGGV